MTWTSSSTRPGKVGSDPNMAAKRKSWDSGKHGKQILIDEETDGQFAFWKEAAKRLGFKSRAHLIRKAVTEFLERNKIK